MSWNQQGNQPGKPTPQKRDPWSGGDNSKGPPDLDALLKNLGKRLKKGLPNGGGDSGDSFNFKGGAATLLGIVIAVILLVWFIAGIFIVHPAEQAVVLRFGKYIETVGSGPHWIPAIMDSKNIVNIQKISNFSYSAQMLTKDENIVSVKIAVQYRIDNPNNYLFNAVNPQASIQQATASALRQVIGHTTLDDVLTVGREQVRHSVKEQLEKILGRYKVGIDVVDVSMQPAKAPDEVRAAFDDAIKAQEDEQRYENKAQAYSRGVEALAQGDAKRLLAEAKAYKEKTILISKGEVARFLALLPEYNRAKTVTRERLYIQTLESVFTHTSKVLVDNGNSSNLLYLPLDKIIKTVRDTKKDEPRDFDFNNGNDTQVSMNSGTSNDNYHSSNQRSRDSYQGRGDY